MKKIPLSGLVCQSTAALGGDVVILPAARPFKTTCYLRILPLGADEAIVLQPMQNGVNRAFLPLKEVLRILSEAFDDLVSVRRLRIERCEDEQ